MNTYISTLFLKLQMKEGMDYISKNICVSCVPVFTFMCICLRAQTFPWKQMLILAVFPVDPPS